MKTHLIISIEDINEEIKKLEDQSLSDPKLFETCAICIKQLETLKLKYQAIS